MNLIPTQQPYTITDTSSKPFEKSDDIYWLNTHIQGVTQILSYLLQPQLRVLGMPQILPFQPRWKLEHKYLLEIMLILRWYLLHNYSSRQIPTLKKVLGVNRKYLHVKKKWKKFFLCWATALVFPSSSDNAVVGFCLLPSLFLPNLLEIDCARFCKILKKKTTFFKNMFRL